MFSTAILVNGLRYVICSILSSLEILDQSALAVANNKDK